MMQRLGNVDDQEMFRTFNMGIGMMVVVSSVEADRVRDAVGGYTIGRVVEGEKEARIV
jgi:phosphoribosylformylglycinamidine cyclo-ligase